MAVLLRPQALASRQTPEFHGIPSNSTFALRGSNPETSEPIAQCGSGRICCRPPASPPSKRPVVACHATAGGGGRGDSRLGSYGGEAAKLAALLRLQTPDFHQNPSSSSSSICGSSPETSRRIAQCGVGRIFSKRASTRLNAAVVVCHATTSAGEGDDKLSSYGGATEEGEDRGQWDVSSNCVKPAFRVSPVAAEDLQGVDGTKVHVLFLSEGNVCRSVYAEAMFSRLLEQRGLQDLVHCSSKATRDYNVGETADARAVSIAEEHGLELPREKVATVFDCSADIVMADLLLVMDKFTASDVLKEVTVYEIVNKKGMYSSKVRRLGEFCQLQQIEDIEDPLYGNMGGTEELESVREIYAQVRDSCEGLIDYILDVHADLRESESFKDGIARALGRMNALNWLAPPMLSKV